MRVYGGEVLRKVAVAFWDHKSSQHSFVDQADEPDQSIFIAFSNCKARLALNLLAC